MVVEARYPDRAVRINHGQRAQVDRGIEKLLDHVTKDIGIDKSRNLISELEFVQDFFNVRREAIKMRLKVSAELLGLYAGAQIAQQKWSAVVERLTGCLPKRSILVCDARLVQAFFHIQDSLLCGFKHGVQAPDNGHRQITSRYLLEKKLNVDFQEVSSTCSHLW
jgi:hypothetical protein